MTSGATPDTPADPRAHSGIEETVRLTRAELMSGILVGIGGAHDVVPTQVQLDRAVDMIFRYARRRDRQVAEAIVRELDRLAAEPADSVTNADEGSLRSQASDSPSITPEQATALYLAVSARDFQRSFDGKRITTSDIADVFREHGIDVVPGPSPHDMGWGTV